MKSVFFLFVSLVLAPVGYALTDDQQFLEQLRDQSAALLEQSLPPEGVKPPEISAKDKAWIDNLLAKQQQSQQHAADAAKAQTEKESPFVYFVSFSISEAGLKQMVPEATQLGIPTLINGPKIAGRGAYKSTRKPLLNTALRRCLHWSFAVNKALM